MKGLLLMALSGLVAAIWWRLLRGKEKARRVASIMCRNHGLLLMDDTVMLSKATLFTDPFAHGYGLEYRFDFVHEGLVHTGGSVVVGSGDRARVVIPTRSGRLIEEY